MLQTCVASLSCQERGQDVPRRANTRLSLTRAARRFRGLGLAVRPLIGEDSRCILRTQGPGITVAHMGVDMASPWCHDGAMDLRMYVENIHNQLVVAAEAGGDEAGALAERLVAPLDAAIRLALQDVLSAAAEEITCELAPGSVELRLRGRDPEFVVTPPPVDVPVDDLPEGDRSRAPNGWPVATGGGTPPSVEADEAAVSRINLRMPDQLKTRIEQAAAGEGLSVNSWLVRAAAASLERTDPGRRREPRAPKGAQRYTGWAR